MKHPSTRCPGYDSIKAGLDGRFCLVCWLTPCLPSTANKNRHGGYIPTYLVIPGPLPALPFGARLDILSEVLKGSGHALPPPVVCSTVLPLSVCRSIYDGQGLTGA